MSKYHTHKLKCSPDHYLTSYSCDYSSMFRKLSPIIAADLILQANKKLTDYQSILHIKFTYLFILLNLYIYSFYLTCSQ